MTSAVNETADRSKADAADLSAGAKPAAAAVTDVAAALIWDDDKFMICQRPAHKARALLWEFVGGKAEPGESLEETLIRECREELAVRVEVGELFTSVLHEYPDIKIRLSLFNARIAEGTPQLLEHVAIKWIRPDEIEQYDFCPADKDILALLKEHQPPLPKG